MAMVLFGAGFALLSPASAAVVGDVAGGRGGTVVAGYQMAADIGAVIGPLAAGWLADNVSYGAAWGVSGGVLALGLVMAAVMPETRKPPSPEPAAA
jgi:MFS family permease